MEKSQMDKIKENIDQAEVVSFDVFDTLLYRIVNTPEDIFKLTGDAFGLFGFKEQRMKYQQMASEMVCAKGEMPHADIDTIYEVIAEKIGGDTDWKAVKAYEIEMESRALVANPEMKAIYDYAIKAKKKVIAISDMYLRESHIRQFLSNAGYTYFDAVFVSSDVHQTKYEGGIFAYAASSLKVPQALIFHIGDNPDSDFDNAVRHGVKAHYYINSFEQDVKEREKKAPVNSGYFGQACTKILYNKNQPFWYRLGVEAGGPLYLGLYRWLLGKLKVHQGEKVYFLSRDGYNLHQIFKDAGQFDTTYLYTSRRAMLLAGIDTLDEASLALLPPFAFGQTVGEVLEYLGVYEAFKDSITQVGFEGPESLIKDPADEKKFRQMYRLNEAAFLERCKQEREWAVNYYKSQGFYDGDAVVFDCGWNGSSQYLLQRFLERTDYKYQCKFYYTGIMNTERSKTQLKGCDYEAYLFDQNRDQLIQDSVVQAIAILELFFGAPHQSLWYYGPEGPVFETDIEEVSCREEICQGILDFIHLAFDFAERYKVDALPEQVLGSIMRLINDPTVEEATVIGNLYNVDGFANKKGTKRYLAYLTTEEFDENPGMKIYWLQGILRRPDISEEAKARVLGQLGLDGSVYYQGKEDEETEEEEKLPEGTKILSGYEYILKEDGKVAYEYVKAQKNRELPEQDRKYQTWMNLHEEDALLTEILGYKPLISVVVPVYNVNDAQLTACIDSVIRQTYTNWELILVDDASTWESVRNTLSSYEGDPQIQVIYRKVNGNISEATNDGLLAARGEFIAFMDCDDMIAVNALYEMVKVLNEHPDYDFIYSDEDKLSEDGRRRHAPFFKPDWSPDTFMSMMYTNHLGLYRKCVADRVGGLRTPFNGAQDYDFTLRFLELTEASKIGHIPKVLYYWRERGESLASGAQAKPYALEAVKRAKEEALSRRGISGRMEYVSDLSQYRVIYDPIDQPLVSIIIPSKDNVEMFKTCIRSLKKYTTYPNYEIILVDNGSSPEHKAELDGFTTEQKIVYHYEPMTFNFSAMCNKGAALAKGQVLLFLNDDIEIIQRDWLERMTGHAQQSWVGAVGAKLLYPYTSKIQHAGVLNLSFGPSHSLLMMNDQQVHHFGRNRIEYNFLAVTGACLMVTADKFKAVDGFDETFPVAYNDVDLCFKFVEQGWYNVLRNDVVLYHHESVSRGDDCKDEAKMARLLKEKDRLYEKHPEFLNKDPFYNPNLIDNRNDFDINVKVDTGKVSAMVETNRVYKRRWVRSDIRWVIDDIYSMDNGNVLIKGWAHIINGIHNDLSTVKLVLQNPQGKTWEAEVERIYRPDVSRSQSPGKKGNGLSGFECVVNGKALDLQNDTWQIGIYILGPYVQQPHFIYTDRTIGKPLAE